MSIINQVLNQLERRGMHTTPEQTMVRAVPYVKRKSAMSFLALGLVLAIGIAAWQWTMQAHKPNVATVSIVQHQPVVAEPAPASVVPATAAAAGETPLAEMLPPASRLSPELSSVPLPSSLREVRNPSALSEACPEPCQRVEETAANAAPPAQTAKPSPAPTVMPNVQAAVQPSSGVSPMKQVNPAQRADMEFRKAVALMQQGHIADAIMGYEATLRLDAGHDAARQALVALLLEGKRGADAERVLQDGLKVKSDHTGFAMLLARLQVDRGAVERATATLEKSLPYADAQADYQAFFAALRQRQNRHKEAITHYQIALRLAPNNGVWLMGYGISLQAVQRADDAKDAFRRAIESKTLSPELQAFVQQKLKEL